MSSIIDLKTNEKIYEASISVRSHGGGYKEFAFIGRLDNAIQNLVDFLYNKFYS